MLASFHRILSRRVTWLYLEVESGDEVAAEVALVLPEECAGGYDSQWQWKIQPQHWVRIAMQWLDAGATWMNEGWLRQITPCFAMQDIAIDMSVAHCSRRV